MSEQCSRGSTCTAIGLHRYETKKHRPHLTERVREPSRCLRSRATMMRNTSTNDAHARLASRNTMRKSDSVKTHMLSAFAKIQSIEKLHAHANANFNHPQRARRANRDAVSLLH